MRRAARGWLRHSCLQGSGQRDLREPPFLTAAPLTPAPWLSIRSPAGDTRSDEAALGGSVRRATIGILAGVAGLSVLLAGVSLTRSGAPDALSAAGPRPGEALLQAFECHSAEIKRILVRGVEDDFSPQGEERTALSPTLESERYRSHAARSRYDNSQPDSVFVDHFTLPARIADGLFVISLRAVGENGNDQINLGDIPSSTDVDPALRDAFGALIAELEQLEGWTREGSLYYARLSQMPVRARWMQTEEGRSLEPWGERRSLLAYVRDGQGDRHVDVVVADDTSVDFMGLAVCEEPPPGEGLTMVVAHSRPENAMGLIAMSAQNVPLHSYLSNPYVGDTACGSVLPVGCFLPLEAPAPQTLQDSAAERGLTRLNWSGGVFAAAPPVAGDAFTSIGDADAYCAAQFGPGWRVSTYHDGGVEAEFVAFGGTAYPDARHWIDIRGQPYATCWAH